MGKVSKNPYKNIVIIITVVLIIIVSLIIVFTRSINTPEDTLSEFYNAVYVSSNLEDMESCLVESYRYYFEQAVTMAGMEPLYYQTYRDESVKLYNKNFHITIKVTDQEYVNEAQLSKLRQKYGQFSAAQNVTYDITFLGEKKEETFSNTIDMVQIRGKWYMVTHLTLPIGKNIYAY